ncbi:MAG: 5-(carboxyamino)imidazole ribonucleotide mutase [Ignavibacteriaceae bacterium]|nr:5-(carboxyamino)imidazole ribonucleotide mutase [Ignavibacteriaceae bacterium]
MTVNPLVGILMGSDSDLEIMKEASVVLDQFEIPNELKILSAHRTPKAAAEYAETAHGKGIKVIIAGAGGAAHLAGVIAAFSPLPIIAVPIKSKSLEGLDSLLSMVQMPSGVPVATVAINGAKNAGILAAQILGTSDAVIQRKILDFKISMEKEVTAKNEKLLNLKSQS